VEVTNQDKELVASLGQLWFGHIAFCETCGLR